MTFWDVFMLRDELDMLECRLTEMEGYDVIHVLTEAGVTHRGGPKPLHYLENQARFARWKDRICPVSHLPEPPGSHVSSPWEREHRQRDLAWEVLRPEPDDLVLIADVDEIPSAAVLAARPSAAALVMQRCACFAADWLWPHPEPTGVLARGWFLDGRRSLAEVRDARAGFPPIEDGGWHLSWMGGHEAHLAKLAAHCHAEQDTPEITDTITSGRAYREGWHIGTKLIPADVDGSWPRYVRERRCPASWFRPRGEA